MKGRPPHDPTKYATYDPSRHPTAPAIATIWRPNRPVATRYPENGMMISDGSGIHALSIAIITTTPPYPSAEIVAMIKPESAEITLSSILERVAWCGVGCEQDKNKTLF